jgi:uncharacterized protein YdhG (YjbR/CyaY superfamily)
MSGFTKAERDAMKQRADEMRATKGLKGAAKKAKELEDCLAAIDGLDGFDRELATQVHRVVTDVAPELEPKTWYGFPSYARDGKVVVFVQFAAKFGTRYATLGFNEDAVLDDGAMWPTAYAIVEWNDSVEKKVRALVRKAAG